MSEHEAAKKPSSAGRRKARHYAMQTIYGWQIAGGSAAEVEAKFRADNDMSNVDLLYFHELLQGVVGNGDALDALYVDYLDRSLKELDQVERALLRMASFELAERIDVPYKVVINEAVALAKKFGATDSYKYLNGVLDASAKKLREAETNS
jgi:N utilization substance protein B